VEGTFTAPTVYQVYNDSESVRAMAWYIEGPERGILYDALQTSVDVRNLKDHIDTIATKPYICILGHEHGDHAAQAPAFIEGGIDVYANNRGWAAMGMPGGFGAVLTTPQLQSKVMNVDEGDAFDLGGGIVFNVYAMPGHANGNIVLHDKQSGMVFSSDIYGCTRAGSADNVGVSGLPADLLLSFAQQVHSFYLQDGGKVTMLFTGHDEYPLKENNLDLFEAALQQVVDSGEAGCSPSLRSNGRPNSRATTIGDMWKDGTDWISLVIGGTLGDDTEYLTHNDFMNYNGGDGYKRYSVLSNVELTGGDLVGTTVAWAEPNTFEWNGNTVTVPNAISGRFDPWTFDYEVHVASGTSNITICPVSMSTKATAIRLNGREVAYRSINRVDVSDGSVITIEVVAPDAATSCTYTFKVKEV
jgi:glyoxylase-like metal-dependent hydrolase (beta-lactamase superfamily II)